MPSPEPWTFLSECSDESLRMYELARMNHAANLRKELLAVEEDLREAETMARLAHLVRERRELLRSMLDPRQELFDFVGIDLAQPATLDGLPRRDVAKAADHQR